MLGLDIPRPIYLCTNFNDCSCNRSRDVASAHQNFNDSRDL